MEHTQLSWHQRGQLWLRLGLRGALALGGAALVVWVGVPLASLLSPFLFALVLAWVLNPAVRWLQRRTNASRKAVSMVLVVLVFAVIGGVLFGLGWIAVDQVRSLFDNRQSLLDELLGGLVSVVNSVSGWLGGLVPQGVLTTSEDLVDAFVGWVQGLDFSGWLTEMAGQAPSMVTGVSNFAVALVVFMMGSYFITGDYPRLRFELADRVPMVARDFCRSVKDIFMSAFGGYVKSQLILSAGVFMILTIGFLLMRQPYGLLLAFGLAVLDFIPIIGSGTMMVPWAVVDMVLGNYGEAAALMSIWGVIALFRRFAEPKILGDQTGLSPILSLVGIYVGMKLGGVLGMVVGPLLLLVCINLAKLGIFRPVLDDLALAARDIDAILRSGRRAREDREG
ncbi:MAG: sporulation integral membrane protein YtvI [Oscillospiraceae bacterium]|nr:sporulation integral membrane protein YtvI [Oscillospiraceae bacterium]MCI9308728.1 sporulation integral membrane protein YtvI [Oscillospiraceae bacterium]MCI9549729.1 sporulation integral membrane protein YtvI [Oscillospiraceae bacterium]